MLELIQITNDPAFARRCDALPGFRLFVDLERIGKAERQAGRNTFISAHQVDDVSKIKRVLRQSPLMVRVNPLHDGTPGEVEAALQQGADRLMLPMFTRASEVGEFARLVGGRAPVTLLLETAGALACLDEWIATPGLDEVYVGLNDLHLSMGQRFMFEPLAQGWVDRVATAARRQHLRFGFGGIARLDEGLLPGRDVLAEHLRLGSGAVILSRTFHRGNDGEPFEAQVQKLRQAEAELAQRTPTEIAHDARRIASVIERVACGMGPAA
ncbi:MAG TPA: aldolase/citrate lyase family protein [Ramlibacter sp.]|nr:aldolase/citrate lyase family protein [Ramlibacter sp.]